MPTGLARECDRYDSRNMGLPSFTKSRKDLPMKSKLATCAIALLLAAPLGASALGKNEKGCLAGGAIGGLGGHFLGSGSTTNTVLGAAAGCAVGTVVADNKKKKDSRANENAKTARYTDREQQRREREQRRINAQY